MIMDWSLIRNFLKKEWVTDPSKIDITLVQRVDELATFVKQEHGSKATCIIHVAYEPAGHSIGSQHYFGRAVDLHFNKLSLMEQYLAAERFNFPGLGIYPYWQHPGLHLDIRELTSYKGARWWRSKKGEYLNVNAQCVDLMLNGVA